MRKNIATKTLVQANKRLANGKAARAMRIRSIASSTAIETRESISDIESKIRHKRSIGYRVKLA
jgi:hypothetical protein